ncbi:MAG: enhanced serine sensitivity protein SseB C-terminal domain-containing protein [Planctomycetota bacterium]|jgi:hypothetical protein
MAFKPENKLEKSLIKAANDPVYLPQFYKDFLESNIFIVQEEPLPQKTGSIMLNEGDELKIQNIDWNGKPYIPIFSSLTRFQATLQEETGYISLNALEFLKITQGAEVLLNPGSDFGKELTKNEIQSIIDGSIWEPTESYRVEKETEVLIGEPANYPHKLTKALSRLFRNIQEVKRAYLAHFFNPEKDEKAHTLIGIEVSGNWEQVSAQAGLVARDINVPDPPIDFIQITGQGEVDEYFLDECKPFYKKKVLGFF